MKTLFYIFPLFAALLCISVVTAQDSPKNQSIEEIFGDEGEIYFSFTAESKDQVNQLTRIVSIDDVSIDLEVRAYANRAEFEKFMKYGINFHPLPHPGDVGPDVKMLDDINSLRSRDWDFYPTYDAYVEMMFQFASDYPSLCHIINIGSTNQGRDLLVANISDNVGINENEPEFLYTSSIHGDEITGYVLMLRLIDSLLTSYGTDPRITEIVNNLDIYINPLANPDGTYAGGNNTVNGARRGNAFWIDMNRNYPDPADGPHPDGNQWQTETVAFMEFAENRNFVMGANFHGGAEVLNYPWDTWSYFCADNDWWVYVCREYADTVHVYGPPNYLTDLDNGITNGYAWYRITGGRQDYMNYFHQCRELTIEISDVKTPPASQLPAFWEYNRRSLISFMEQCQYGIRGTVKDASTGWPVEAEVFVLLHEADSSWVYSSLPVGNYHRLLEQGTYTVRYSAPGYETAVRNNLTVSNRQANIMDVLLVPSTGVGGLGNNPLNQFVEIFPVPVRENHLNIRSDLAIDRIVMYDATGKTLLEKNNISGYDRFDVSAFRNGVYFLRFWTDQGEGLKKFIVNR